MADSGTLVKVGLFGGAAFLAYKYFIAPSGTASSPVAATTTPSGTTPAVPAKPASSYNTASALLARITAAASAAGMTSASPDEWNVLYVQAGGPGPAPDPVAIFGGRPAMSLAQYWAGMSAWLASEKGLTGFGVYAGLGALVFGGRQR